MSHMMMSRSLTSITARLLSSSSTSSSSSILSNLLLNHSLKNSTTNTVSSLSITATTATTATTAATTNSSFSPLLGHQLQIIRSFATDKGNNKADAKKDNKGKTEESKPAAATTSTTAAAAKTKNSKHKVEEVEVDIGDIGNVEDPLAYLQNKLDDNMALRGNQKEGSKENEEGAEQEEDEEEEETKEPEYSDEYIKRTHEFVASRIVKRATKDDQPIIDLNQVLTHKVENDRFVLYDPELAQPSQPIPQDKALHLPISIQFIKDLRFFMPIHKDFVRYRVVKAYLDLNEVSTSALSEEEKQILKELVGPKRIHKNRIKVISSKYPNKEQNMQRCYELMGELIYAAKKLAKDKPWLIEPSDHNNDKQQQEQQQQKKQSASS